MKKRCELCRRSARIYCDSDNASLCYDCDLKVHSANFLAAKHFRTLLCHNCQSPTPWIASGLNLSRAASVCVNCLDGNSSPRRMLEDETSRRGNGVVEENCIIHDELDEEIDAATVGDDEEDINEEEEEEEDEDEDGENQVVPWSSVASPLTTASSSTGDEFSSYQFSSDCSNAGTKRKRMDADIYDEDSTGCSSERFKGKSRTESAETTSLRPSEQERTWRSPCCSTVENEGQ